MTGGFINYDIRNCIGDNAKWLDDTCVMAYLTAAGYLTTSFERFIRIGPSYARSLREVHFHCITLSAVCLTSASHGCPLYRVMSQPLAPVGTDTRSKIHASWRSMSCVSRKRSNVRAG